MYTIFGSVFSFADLAYAGDSAKFFSFSYLHYRKGLLLAVAGGILLAVLLAVLLPKKRYRFYRPMVGLLMIAAAWRESGT